MDLPKTSFEKAVMYLPKRFREDFLRLPSLQRNEIQEIRLTVNKPIYIVKRGKIETFSDIGVTVTEKDIEECVNSACEYSIHSYSSQLANGYITVCGGHRIGLCGTAVINDETVTAVKNISGLNIRIAKQIIGCADEIIKTVFNKEICGVLIAGSPASGKTTMLRDIARQLGKEYKVSVIDERSEIAATYRGVPQNDVGRFTDVFDSYDKPRGITIATRVMSPDIIICDEIGTEKEAEKIETAALCGVKIIASVHAGSLKELYNKKQIKKLIKKGIFEKIIVLGNGENIGKIIDMEVKGDKAVGSNSFDNYGSSDRKNSFGKIIKAM